MPPRLVEQLDRVCAEREAMGEPTNRAAVIRAAVEFYLRHHGGVTAPAPLGIAAGRGITHVHVWVTAAGEMHVDLAVSPPDPEKSG